MPAPTLLILAPGFSHSDALGAQSRATRRDYLLASITARPALSDEAALAAIQSGLGRPVDGAPTLLEIVDEHGPGALACNSLARAIAAVEEGVALVQLSLPRGLALDCLDLAEALPEANLFVVGYGTGDEPSALWATGPDIHSAEQVDAELVDVHPTLLSHLQILPPPGPMPDGRALHEIFRRFHLGEDEQEEVIAHLRAVGYIE